MKYSLCLDIGTTNMRCAICDPKQQNKILTIVYDKVHTVKSESEHEEIKPDQLWTQIVDLMKKCISSAKISINEIFGLGISAQRNTFLTWNKTSGEEFHNFILWNDLRANELVEEYNNSWRIWGLNKICKILYYITGVKRFQAGSVFKLMNAQVLPRLAWVLREIPSVRHHLANHNVLYGTLDTWLIYKLTGGSTHVTDLSHASASGIYDPFTRAWAGWALGMFGIPARILPGLVPSACERGGDLVTSACERGGDPVTLACEGGGDPVTLACEGGEALGEVDEGVLGRAIPILCSMADQSASMFGLDCLQPGDIKLTLGTGSFMDVNTGKQPHASLAGLYPLVGWHIPDIGHQALTYLVEGASHESGNLVEWGLSIGLYKSFDELTALASCAESSDSVLFFPGLRELDNDPGSVTGFIGVSSRTEKKHLVRALLECVAFRVKQIYEKVLSETDLEFSSIKVDGGASRNNFLCQLIADLTGLRVRRSAETETSIVGVAKAMYRGRSQDSESEPKFTEPRRSQNTGNEFLPKFSGDSSAETADYSRVFSPSSAGSEKSLLAYELWSLELAVFEPCSFYKHS